MDQENIYRTAVVIALAGVALIHVTYLGLLVNLLAMFVLLYARVKDD